MLIKGFYRISRRKPNLVSCAMFYRPLRTFWSDVWDVIGKVIVCFQLKRNWLFPNIHMILGEMHISTTSFPVRKQWKCHSLALTHRSTRHKMQYKPLRHVGIIFYSFYLHSSAICVIWFCFLSLLVFDRVTLTKFCNNSTRKYYGCVVVGRQITQRCVMKCY